MKISVLLADDHQMLLDLWAHILTKDGRFQICGKATNGKLAVDIAKTKYPDLALVDINMGPPDGFETTKQLLRHSPFTKVIAVSMYVLPVYARKIRNLGAMGYVTKSSPADELIKAAIEVHNNRPYICRQIQNLVRDEELSAKQMNHHSALTAREIEIIQLIEKGLTSREIAEKLYLSPKTINIHRYNIFKKLEVKNISMLIAKAQALGL